MKVIDTFSDIFSYSKILTTLSILIALTLSYALMSGNAYLLTGIIALFLFIVLLKNNEIGFYIILISVFFADWLWQLGLIPVQFTWLPEIIIIFYLLKAIILKRIYIKTPLNKVIFAFFIVGIISAIINAKDIISVLLTFRLDFKFILMFYLLLLLKLPEKFYKNQMKLILILLLIQIPVAIIKYFIYGQGEMAIGTYGLYGGTYSTFIPMLGIAIILPMMLFNRIKIFWGILALLGFIIFSIVGGKKGLLYFGPPVVLFILLKALFIKPLRLKIIKFSPIFIIVLISFSLIIYFVPWLRPAIYEKGYIKDFIYIYDIKYTQYGDPAGRIPSIITTFNILKADFAHFLFGYGPGSTIKSYFQQYDTRAAQSWPIWIEYGSTEITQKLMEYGCLGLLFSFVLPIIIMLIHNEKKSSKLNNHFLHMLSLIYSSVLFVYFIFGIGYSYVFHFDMIGYLFWFGAATCIKFCEHFD